MSFSTISLMIKIVQFLCLIFPLMVFSQIHLGEGAVIYDAENSINTKYNYETISSDKAYALKVVYVLPGTIISGEISGSKIVYKTYKETKNKKKEVSHALIIKKKSTLKKEIIQHHAKKKRIDFLDQNNENSNLLSYSFLRSSGIIASTSSKQNKYEDIIGMSPIELEKKIQFYFNKKDIEKICCSLPQDLHLNRCLRAPPFL